MRYYFSFSRRERDLSNTVTLGSAGVFAATGAGNGNGNGATTPTATGTGTDGHGGRGPSLLLSVGDPDFDTPQPIGSQIEL